MKKYLFIALAVLLLAVSSLVYIVDWQRKSINRLRHNEELLLADKFALGDSLEHYKTKSKDYAVSVGVLQLSKAELERHCTRLKAEVRDLGIKLKRVEQASTAATNTQFQIIAQLRDSIKFVRDSTPSGGHLDSLRYVHWQDPWVTFRGELRGDTLKANFASKDTLLQVVHRVPKKFLFFRWGTKELRQEIKCSNPHTTITYAECIDVK